MNEQFDNTLVSEMNGGSGRPQFLTVLCVLSFVMCGLMLVITLYGMVSNSPERMQESIERMREIAPATADEMQAQFEEQQNSVMTKIQPIISLVLLFGSFFGVLKMFNLKKVGFYIYILSELVPYIFMITGGKAAMSMLNSMGNGAVTAALTVVLVLMVLADLAFFVMYGMNLKYMNKTS